MDEERREIDLPLVEVGLSSAQYGASVVESACMFLCEHVCECVYIKVFVSCVFPAPVPAPLRAPVYLGVRERASLLLCQPPYEVNTAALGKQSAGGRGQSSRGERGHATCTQTLLYTPLITQFHEGQPEAREGLSR